MRFSKETTFKNGEIFSYDEVDSLNCNKARKLVYYSKFSNKEKIIRIINMIFCILNGHILCYAGEGKNKLDIIDFIYNENMDEQTLNSSYYFNFLSRYFTFINKEFLDNITDEVLKSHTHLDVTFYDWLEIFDMEINEYYTNRGFKVIGKGINTIISWE